MKSVAPPPPSRQVSIGTISFARCGPEMLLPPSERVRLILAASDAYEPDLLVTAGYAIHSRKHLHRLAHDIGSDDRNGVIITEVHHDGRPQRSAGRSHAMWAIESDGELYRFGRQAFAQSCQVRPSRTGRLLRFKQAMERRTIVTADLTVFALCCGELGIVQGREAPRFIDDDVAAVVLAADIVINPTHDRMSNAGTLAAKRRYLSQRRADGGLRAYVSCSNWEACGLNGRIQRPSPTLHTAYVAGEPQPYAEFADGGFGFVYRQWQLTL